MAKSTVIDVSLAQNLIPYRKNWLKHENQHKKHYFIIYYNAQKLWEIVSYMFWWNYNSKSSKIHFYYCQVTISPTSFADELLLSYACLTLIITMEVNSSVNKFVLLGLTQNLLKDKVVFVIFLLLYLATLLVNILIVMTIRNSQILGSPMYFFFFYLSFADACFSTTTAPRLIVDSVSEKKVISFNGCMTQIFAFHFFGGMGILVLVLMSFDCYVAICKLLW